MPLYEQVQKYVIDKYEDKGQRVHRIFDHRMVLPVFYQRAYSCLLGFSEKIDT
jgi:hypothetical protein